MYNLLKLLQNIWMNQKYFILGFLPYFMGEIDLLVKLLNFNSFETMH